jgi:protein disulfide-isomerase A6
MKPDWDKLAEKFADSSTVLIADVDCTVEKDLCSQYGVRGYPTIKYFSGSTAPDGDKYEGGRDYASLETFASENLGPSCGNDYKELCDEGQLAILAEANALSAADRAAWIEGKASELKQAETDFTEAVKQLQATYEQLTKTKESTIAAITPSLRLYRSIKDNAEGHDEL